MAWYYVLNNQKAGPVDDTGIKGLIDRRYGHTQHAGPRGRTACDN